MKTFTKILTAAAATALLATGCVNEDPAYKNNEPGTPPDPNAKGYLTLADMSMRVVVDTDTETRPDDTSDETAKPQTRTDEAQPDVDTFIIEIRDATGKLALQETYGDLKVSIGEAGRLELPVGGYTMEVRSEEAATTPAAEWEHPVYFGSQEFVIEKNQTTPINEVVCTLNNIKVTLMCSKDLADQLTAEDVYKRQMLGHAVVLGADEGGMPGLLLNPPFILLVLTALIAPEIALEKHLERRCPYARSISFVSDRRKITLDPAEISYVESNDSEVWIHTAGGLAYRTKTRISQWETQLDSRFPVSYTHLATCGSPARRHRSAGRKSAI